MSDFDLLDIVKNLGQGEAGFTHFSVDFWNDNMFLGDNVYPSGYFVVELLNIEKADCDKNFALAQSAKELISKLKADGYNLGDYNKLKELSFAMFEFVSTIPPLSLLEIDIELSRLEDACGEATMMFIESNSQFAELLYDKTAVFIKIIEEVVIIRDELINFYEKHLKHVKIRDENNFVMAISSFFFTGGSELFYAEQFKNKENSLPFFAVKAKTSFMRIITKHPTENKTLIAERFYFNSLKDFVTTDLLNALHYGNSFSQCGVCDRYFLNTSARNPKYCDRLMPNHPKGFTCRQEAASRGRKKKENSDDHPIKALCSRRLNTINKHRKSDVISEEFAKKAKSLAQQKRDKALYDNDYYLNHYETEISQAQLYAEVEKLLR